MNSHNSKTKSVVRSEAIHIVTGKDDVRVVSSRLMDVDVLSIAETDDRGSDPYNNTGQHVIIKSK